VSRCACGLLSKQAQLLGDGRLAAHPLVAAASAFTQEPAAVVRAADGRQRACECHTNRVCSSAATRRHYSDTTSGTTTLRDQAASQPATTHTPQRHPHTHTPPPPPPSQHHHHHHTHHQTRNLATTPLAAPGVRLGQRTTPDTGKAWRGGTATTFDIALLDGLLSACLLLHLAAASAWHHRDLTRGAHEGSRNSREVSVVPRSSGRQVEKKARTQQTIQRRCSA
jgi:hypothetical protein